ncbi:MAG: hypothetical protein RL748_1336 [Pseudomonadota bacterium]|jgi:signal transduction histidine kinase
MEFFSDNEALAQLEQDFLSAQGEERITLQVALSWQLRQRNEQRALALADAAAAALAALEGREQAGTTLRLSQPQRQLLVLRLLLVRAESALLHNQIEAALALAHQAQSGFLALGQLHGALAGYADACWLRAWIAQAQGQGEVRDQALLLVIHSGISDPVRLLVAQATLARYLAFEDVLAAKRRWGEYFGAQSSALHPGARCWLEDALGVFARYSGDFVPAIERWSQTFSLALVSGQLRHAIVAAINIGEAFYCLDEYQTALQWVERGMTLARRHDWPGMTGLALIQTATTLSHLQQYEIAQDMLQEALELLSSLPASRAYSMALWHLAEVELVCQDYAPALKNFEWLQQRAIELKHADHLHAARCGQAHALLGLGQAENAQQVAQLALAEASSEPRRQVDALRVVAQIHARHPALPRPAGISVENVALHYLSQAYRLGSCIEGYLLAPDLLAALAQEYAKEGDYPQAFQFVRRASSARESSQARATNNRALALQVAHQTERAEIKEAHQRELAAEARRAEILQQTSDTLAHLGSIGQEITAHLDMEQVFEVFKRHVQHLLPMDLMTIYLMSDDKQSLNRSFRSHHPDMKPNFSVQLNDPVFDAARCARERIFIMADQDPDLPDPRWVLASKPTLSRMIAPLALADEVLGVITIQSYQRFAYAARDQMILRTLCAYAAIALSNARAHGALAQAHKRLQETQQQLVLQGKMAGLGTLTAGVAHEINNPVNFVHVAVQNQRVDIAEFEQFVAQLVEADADPEILQAFRQRFARLFDNVAIMLNGTERIKGIVKDLRAFTRLDEADKKTVHLSECLLSTLNLVRTSWQESVEFITEFDCDPQIECWPALLNQVFMNLLVNACQAIDEKRNSQAGSTSGDSGDTRGYTRGKLWLRLQHDVADNHVVISIEDNGPGMDAATQARIMEPFYTTKAVGVGTGLGLSIAFQIVEKHGGHLYFASTPGEGSCFTLRLPLMVAESQRPVGPTIHIAL